MLNVKEVLQKLNWDPNNYSGNLYDRSFRHICYSIKGQPFGVNPCVNYQKYDVFYIQAARV